MQKDPALEPLPSFTPTGKSKVHRLPKQGSYERELIYKILDEGLVCYVGFAIEAPEES
jgi:uncharacterized protein